MPKKFTIAILASGGGTDAPPIIEMCRKEGIDIACILSNKDNNGALEKAKQYQVEGIFLDPVGKTREEYDRETVKILKDKNVDLVCLVGYKRIISSYFVKEYEGRILNVHPSLLPKYGGGMDRNVHQLVLDNGEKETGMTIHLVTEEVDGGEVLCQKSCLIDPNETVESLRNKVQDLEKKWYPEVVKEFRERRGS
ncbi:MAG: phosphoribosylglycinamide formyltransferase, phosphoribosylglycinamide formyltransferase 1 [Candidatus Peregrinibacteria bacterium GW2011_GWF2_33_10]|nr:MAG: phosphoribosylglycinamide formyltransferase, phosphoribosylglycinamide formyltransferase 1 [Candidatus Peregrinibacteria bacterium GW2011_GWF2_33_10]OGJ45604.1 MAG: phosphoribosylglycinamide formyltransferase [Candidatus Peregrinibacteria bacterium RIFOXYA2_FULL_33_21]OGJ46539.1 MAG: phosphoribosylglycinamide formyltransferase [Candidatus Peregrinibacteria bacterium RIFOXYA12_FULL_33_12]OGJ51067.1 MAG: phosphoribosylglycinamide formyltransferase [Candidatus Peregrinibacteria bacterium RI